MDNHCINKIRNIYRAIAAFELQMEQTFNLNINEVMAMCILSQKANMLSGELADEMNLTRSNTSKVIASLEKKGFIERKTCKHDSRCQRFALTQLGEKQLSEVNCNSFEVPQNLQILLKT